MKIRRTHQTSAGNTITQNHLIRTYVFLLIFSVFKGNKIAVAQKSNIVFILTNKNINYKIYEKRQFINWI